MTLYSAILGEYPDHFKRFKTCCLSRRKNVCEPINIQTKISVATMSFLTYKIPQYLYYTYLLFLFWVVLGIEPTALCMLGQHSSTKLYTQPPFILLVTDRGKRQKHEAQVFPEGFGDLFRVKCEGSNIFKVKVILATLQLP